jgi:hypothetical protein
MCRAGNVVRVDDAWDDPLLRPYLPFLSRFNDAKWQVLAALCS